MSLAPVRRRALSLSAALATAVIVPLAGTSLSPAHATTAPAVSVKSAAAVKTVAPLTAAQRKAKHKKLVKARSLARGKKIVKVAARYKGRPYVYGAAGPRAFDCSGYTSYVVRKAVKVQLPRTAAQQSHSRKIKKIKKSNRQVGDLVFFPRGGYVGHVAIYAGKGKIWHSPKPGSRVKKVALYTSHVKYGRLR